MAPQTAVQEAIGNAQQAFADNAKTLREELVETGQCKPYTIVNFNPVDMHLEGELLRYKVPSPEDERLPRDVLRVKLEYDGKERVGHCFTIREPHIYGKNIGAQWHEGGGPGAAVVQRDVKYYLPVAVAYIFLEHFSPIFITGRDGKAAPPPKDARKFYGVLAFEGDINTLQKVLNEPDPGQRIIRVPLATVRQSGKLMQRSYSSVETSLDDYLDRMFAGQLKFADATISRAQQKWNGTDEDRKDISASDRIWLRWAIKLGYAEAPKKGEKSWLNELLTLTSNLDVNMAVPDNRRECQACRQKEPKYGTPFCPNCNAPIDTVKTFMDGFPVPESWLHALPDDKFEIVYAEIQRRAARGNRLPAATAANSTAAVSTARGSYKQGTPPKPLTKAEKAAAARAAEIPAAASTVIPGEED